MQRYPLERYQKGYVRKDGTYVSGHYKTVSDKTNKNNYIDQDTIIDYARKMIKKY